MNKERKLIIAGNWKMNKTVAEAMALVGELKIDYCGKLEDEQNQRRGSGPGGRFEN